MASVYIEQFRDLRVDRAHKPFSVHKPCMLLVVIDLAERGVLAENKLRYEDTLEEFKAYANAVRPGADMKPYLPFFHLNGEDFWSLRPKRGTNDKNLRPSHGRMMGRRASLVPDRFHEMLVSSPHVRHRMRDALIDRWFPRRRRVVEAIISSRRPAN